VKKTPDPVTANVAASTLFSKVSLICAQFFPFPVLQTKIPSLVTSIPCFVRKNSLFFPFREFAHMPAD